MLVGGVLLKPRVDRVIPEPGATGNIPLGPVPLTLTANVDYAAGVGSVGGVPAMESPFTSGRDDGQQHQSAGARDTRSGRSLSLDPASSPVDRPA